MKLQTFSEYQPTSFDGVGLGSDGKEDWLVLPMGRNRDSLPLDESNFHCALEHMGGESELVEIANFGHWACGWFEIIIVHPDLTEKAEQLASDFADYPVVNEEDWSRREWEWKNDIWNDCYSLRERIELCQENGASIFAARHESIPEEVYGAIYVE
jgi:hypothetical protein